MKRENRTLELEMLVIAELISYPHNLRQIDLGGLSGLIVCAESKSVLDVVKLMLDKGEDISLVNVSCRLEDKQVLEELTKAMIKVTTDLSLHQHISYLKDRYVNRFLESQACEMVKMSKDLSIPGTDKLSKFIRDTSDTLDYVAESRSLIPVCEIINTIADDIQTRACDQAAGKNTRVPTGIHELDRFLYGGFGPGNLVVLAGRPSEGKTSIMVHMAKAAASAGIPSLIFSMEMSKEEVVQRFLLSTGDITPEQIHQAKVDDWEKFEAGVSKVYNLPIYVDDSTRRVSDIVSKISMMSAKGLCGAVYIDYLGLLQFVGKQPLYIQIAEVTNILKRLAMDCHCPVVLLCQLNRNNVKENRSPDLQDLRDSGSIEQDADTVLIVERKEGKDVDLWLRKNRNGYGGQVCLSLTHDKTYSNFQKKSNEEDR